MKEKAYEEIGPNYRFFLAWRHAAFAGNLVILWGTCSLLGSAYEKELPIAWVIPLLAALASLCLWIADLRTRQLYRELVVAGKTLEGDDAGPYHALAAASIPKDAAWLPKKDRVVNKLCSQSFSITVFFLGSSFVLVCVAIHLWRHPLVQTQSKVASWEYRVVSGTPPDALQTAINRAVADGWEVVSLSADPNAGAYVLMKKAKR